MMYVFEYYLYKGMHYLNSCSIHVTEGTINVAYSYIRNFIIKTCGMIKNRAVKGMGYKVFLRTRMKAVSVSTALVVCIEQHSYCKNPFHVIWPFSLPSQNIKKSEFLMLSGGIERDHWRERVKGILKCSLQLCSFLLSWILGWIPDTFVLSMALKY